MFSFINSQDAEPTKQNEIVDIDSEELNNDNLDPKNNEFLKIMEELEREIDEGLGTDFQNEVSGILYFDRFDCKNEI